MGERFRLARSSLARAAAVVAATALAACGSAPAAAPPLASDVAGSPGVSAAPTTASPSAASTAPSPAVRSASASAKPPAPRAPSTAKPRVTATARPAAFHFPVPVVVGDATEVITVQGSGTWATVTAWRKVGSTWRSSLSTRSARIGANGLVYGPARHQGTSTTPTGTYSLTQAFGIRTNPGTAMPYHPVTSDDWWVEDNNSVYYNSLRRGSLGGFDTTASENSVNGSEHLITHVGQYDYAVVINYNMAPAVHYRGAGIFLHVSDGTPTAGCVSVPAATMVALLRWLSPSAHPRIAIG